MTGAAFSMLEKALAACGEGRDCILRIDGYSFKIRKLSVPPGEEVAAYAELDDGAAFVFDPDQLAAVTVGAKRR